MLSKWSPLVALSFVAVAAALWLAAAQPPAALAGECPGCAAIEENDGTGWCDHCGAGQYEGKPVACKSCFDAMVSAGKCEKCGVLYAGGEPTKCEGCVAAAKKDGWCDTCGVGFVGNEKVSCKGCYEAMKKDAGECAHCGKKFVKGEEVLGHTLKVDGMTCGGCVSAVKGKLEKVEGVVAVTVSLEKGEAYVEAAEETTGEELCAALDGTQFKVTEVPASAPAPAAAGHAKGCCKDMAHTMEVKVCQACGREGADCKLCDACAVAKGVCSHCLAPTK